MAGVPKQDIGRFNLRRRFSHSATFGSTIAAPATLGRVAKYIKDQGLSEYCTAAARSAVGSYLFGREMSFEYQTAKEGEVAGSPIYNGTDPQIGDTASQSYGFLPDEQSPCKFATDGWVTPAQWQSYPPALDGVAILNYGFFPYNVLPTFDSIKAALISGAADNAPVIANGFWYNEWNNPIGGMVPTPTTSPITRHDYIFIDFKTFPDGIERLVAQLSQGTSFGDGGLLYFTKEAVNTAFASPAYNGVGCTIYRKGGVDPVKVEISIYTHLLMVLGELLSIIKAV